MNKIITKKKQIITIVIGIVVIVGGILTYNLVRLQPDVSLTIFQTEDLQGGAVDLTKAIGKPMIVDVWATWCPPCRASMPALQNAKLKYSDKIDIFLISDETVDKIVTFKNANSYDHLYYLKSKVPMQDFGVWIIPTTYFYNASGKLVAKHTGELDEEVLEEMIAKML